MRKKRSSIEDLFEKIYGYRPAKEGTAYEMLAAAVSKLLGLSEEVFHDEVLRGMFSETLYQVDVLLKDTGGRRFGEAKDYSVRGDPVGRGDLQKLGGALGDTEVTGGAVFSTTGYTAPAREYAEASEDINRKPMDLYTLRPSVRRDAEGRVSSVTVEATAVVPDLEQAKFGPVFGEHAQQELQRLVKEGRIAFGDYAMGIDGVVDSDGSPLISGEAMRARLNPAIRDAGRTSDRIAYASLRTPGGYVQVGDALIEVLGLTYRIPVSTYVEELTVNIRGEIKLVIRDECGELDKAITDEDLRRIRFTESGEAVFEQRT